MTPAEATVNALLEDEDVDWTPDPSDPDEPTHVPSDLDTSHLVVPEEFVDNYIAVALWTTTDVDGTALEDIDAELEEKTKAQMRADCQDFWETNYELVKDNPAQAGCDFWLTRAGHGTGFLDSSHIWGEEGAEHLAEMSEPYGEFHLEVYNGEIHGQ